MKLAMIGTGGIGGYLAVRLTESGHDVAAIARGPHLDAIKSEGLRLLAPSGESRVRPWMATDDPRDVGAVDYIIFAVKGPSLDTAARVCRPLIGSDTAVVPFLNGVEAADRLASVLEPESVAQGVAYISTTVSGPGIISQTGDFARFIFGERDNRSSHRLQRLRMAFREAGIDAPKTDDVTRELWNKFIFFSALSGVTAAARCNLGDVIASPQLASVFQQVMHETANLARARGVTIAGSAEAESWEAAQKYPTDLRSSTAVDLEQGRPLETEWITGAVTRLSRSAGIEAPVNSILYALLSPHLQGQVRPQ